MDYDEIDDSEPIGHDPNKTTKAIVKLLSKLEEGDAVRSQKSTSMEAARLHKLIAKLDSENICERAKAESW
jgi:hypothetical protein